MLQRATGVAGLRFRQDFVITRARQRGVALLALLAAISLGGMYYLYSKLNQATSSQSVERIKRDSEALNAAKRALIGQIVQQTALATEPNPGRLPCPELPANAGNPLLEGLPENAAAGNTFGACAGGGANVVVGRLPWKALGIDKLVDSANEPLWYAVDKNWVIAAAGNNTTINSDTPVGGLTVGATGDVIAVIFAPGPALPGQARSAVTNGGVVPAVANYLDGENVPGGPPLDVVFAANGAAGVNDQVVAITRTELMPEIEAAVADRFEKQIAPGIRSAYSTAPWTVTPTLPFAAAFGDPAAANYRGAAATTRGLLPVTHATSGACSPTPCTPAACVAGPLCDPTFVTWRAGATVTRTGGQTLQNHNCVVGGSPPLLTCTMQASTSIFTFTTSMNIRIDATVDNVGMALRQFTPTVVVAGIDGSINPPFGYTVTPATRTLKTDGSTDVSINTRVTAGAPNILGILGALTCSILGIPLCYQYTVTVPVTMFSDHAAVDPSNANSNWFYRNGWHQLAYYAAAPSVLPSQAAPRSCTTLPSAMTPCLQADYLSQTYSAGSLRGLTLMAGRRLDGQGALAAGDPLRYFEGSNSAPATTAAYATRSPALEFNRTFNDRVVVIDHN
jgi:hypothetical protein